MARKTHLTPEASRTAILDATAQVIVDVGVAGLRLSAVAEKAGMAHPNIIHHFGSRENLIDALAERVVEQTTVSVTEAIEQALATPEKDLIDAIAGVLEAAFAGDRGKLTVWLYLGNATSPLEPHMRQIVGMAHQLHKKLKSDVTIEQTNRLVMLVTLALNGEVICGARVKEALGYESLSGNPANFKRWLAKLLVTVSLPEM